MLLFMFQLINAFLLIQKGIFPEYYSRNDMKFSEIRKSKTIMNLFRNSRQQKDQANDEPPQETEIDSLSAFNEAKNKMLQFDSERKHMLNVDGISAEAEQKFRKLLNDCPVDPSESFLKCIDVYTNSKLFKLLHKMPKGAVLHTHGISTGNFEKFVRHICDEPSVYVWKGEKIGELLHYEFQYHLKKPSDPLWENCSETFKTKGEAYIKELTPYLIMPSCTHRHDGWDRLNDYWGRTRHLVQNVSFWLGSKKYLWTVLTDMLSNGVTYFEMKEVISFAYYDSENDMKEVSLDTVMSRFISIIEDFKREHPEFIGVKIVWTSLKFGSHDTTKSDLENVLRLIKDYPNHVAGFDMAGHEDSMESIAHHGENLIYAKQRAKEENIHLPMMIHAGETHDCTNEQVYDAVLVGCERIGHAYSITRYPSLMKYARENNVVVECCPLSNMCLGYVQDLRNHPGWVMLNHGLIVTISNDDPGMFNYSDVSYDYTAVAKAWGLTLAQIRKIARDSVQYSTLSGSRLEHALKSFDNEWKTWLDNFVQS